MYNKARGGFPKRKEGRVMITLQEIPKSNFGTDLVIL